MLKNYRMPNGYVYQYEEGRQPASAVEVERKPAEPDTKVSEPKNNKARKPVKK